jgi:hypothetical protein
MSSLAGDGIVESYWRWRCRVDVGDGVMLLPSLAGDGAA